MHSATAIGLVIRAEGYEKRPSARSVHDKLWRLARGGYSRRWRRRPKFDRRASFYSGFFMLFDALAVSRPAAKAVFVALLCLRVADLDLYLAVCITGVL